ncbi:HpcH/HpaI aldolase/citrate lyase family protein [Caballeronia insecticola]|uniref:Citrate lyase beta subunit n=1 Tax=Caballeronia insecticola TaxID=758793 RepID=R4WP02_9BURK|nr:CoA ester lyase [Caballeronia insecticola]BAN26274.1 citrate lyase beta subunit [Caballeronia insecticola]
MALSRTFLFVPGNHARRVEKALTANVDAAILDLEDAVAASEKVAARAQVVEALQRSHRARAHVRGYVRINALDTDYAFGDLQAVIARGVEGIVLPKLESVEQLHLADWLIAQLERERGLDANSVELMPIIETGAGFAVIDSLCAAAAQRVPRLKRFAFGAGDFCLDMNLVWSDDELELHAYRSALVLASRAARLEAPVDTVWIRLDDADGLARSAVRARGMGFQGKLCIHPAQCDTVNRAFSPSDADIGHARAVVEAFARAEADGVASIQLDGAFIDYPVAYRAQRVLDFAAQIAARADARANAS